MTLKDVLSPYGIHTASELARKISMSRQQASEIWTGKVGIGKKVGKRIADATGCPFHLLLLYRDKPYQDKDGSRHEPPEILPQTARLSDLRQTTYQLKGTE